MTPPIAVDLRPCADGSAVRTALIAWPTRCAPGWPRHCAPSWPRWDRQTANRSRHRLMPPLWRGHNKSTSMLLHTYSSTLLARCYGRYGSKSGCYRRNRRRASGRTDTRLLHGWWTPAPLEASSVNKWKALSSVPCQWWCHWKLTELERECLLPLHKGFL